MKPDNQKFIKVAKEQTAGEGTSDTASALTFTVSLYELIRSMVKDQDS